MSLSNERLGDSSDRGAALSVDEEANPMAVRFRGAQRTDPEDGPGLGLALALGFGLGGGTEPLL